MHPQNSYITLTYSDEHLPPKGTLVKRDAQLFIKRLRKASQGRVRYYLAGEYGDGEGQREWHPHYHAIIFGRDFDDQEYLGKSPCGENLYRSKELERLWPYGYSSVGAANFRTAGYVARYIMKKLTQQRDVMGPTAVDFHYKGRLPEFPLMSNQIGREYFNKYGLELLRDDYCVVDGIKFPVPRYYRNIIKKIRPLLYEEQEFERWKKAQKHNWNNTRERLKVRERCHEEKAKMLKRSFSVK